MKAGGLRCVKSFARTMVHCITGCRAKLRAVQTVRILLFAETTDQTCQNERAAN